jgi:hypothetical protein
MSAKLAYVWAETRWFFGQTVAWIWGRNLLTACALSGIKTARVYGLRAGRVAFYVTILGKPEL